MQSKTLQARKGFPTKGRKAFDRVKLAVASAGIMLLSISGPIGCTTSKGAESERADVPATHIASSMDGNASATDVSKKVDAFNFDYLGDNCELKGDAASELNEWRIGCEQFVCGLKGKTEELSEAGKELLDACVETLKK